MLLLMHVSCMPEPLEIKDIPAAEPQIVVATQMIPDGPVIISLTRTFGALDNIMEAEPEETLRQIAVDDAIVTIKSSFGTDTLQLFDYGIYGGLVRAFEAGESCELHVSSESLGTVYATTIVQPQVELETVEADLYRNIYDDTLLQVNYAIRDPAGRNWYMLNVQKIGEKEIEQNIINPQTFTLLLEDTQFNGHLFESYFEFTPSSYAAGDTIAVSFSNISEEYYRFMELRLENRLDFFEFLSEPVNYPSNVTGGKGFFNLHVPDVRIFILEEE